MIYLNIVVVKSSVVSGEERYGGYVRKGIGTMELEGKMRSTQIITI